ncbi:MAG: NAD(P)-binding protein [Hyphomicrobiaceae bacterium]|nr:MAG: NAD(P)-binding protein [Hyphomicrobiaceae bacterium]
MADTQVAIVGSGLAGLNAARLLHRSGVGFLLLEARDRPGGRILTVDEAGRLADDGFDLGPSWFWPEMQSAIGELVAELALPAFAQHAEGDAIFERASREAPHRFSGFQQEPQSMRLVGGSAALVRALIKDLPADRLHFRARVTRMRLMERCVELAVDHAEGRHGIVRAEHVIVTLPPRLLEATVRFEPAQEPQTLRRWRETPTWMAPHAKVFAIYDRPFWRHAGFSGTAQSLVGPMAEIHDATTASGRAALFGFVGISPQQRASLDEAAIVTACVEQFARIFGQDAANPHATLYKDWASDPSTATPLDWISAGHPHGGTENWISGPWQTRLILAGSETSVVYAGYLAGAIHASRLAAARLTSRWSAHPNAP